MPRYVFACCCSDCSATIVTRKLYWICQHTVSDFIKLRNILIKTLLLHNITEFRVLNSCYTTHCTPTANIPKKLSKLYKVTVKDGFHHVSAGYIKKHGWSHHMLYEKVDGGASKTCENYLPRLAGLPWPSYIVHSIPATMYWESWEKNWNASMFKGQSSDYKPGCRTLDSGSARCPVLSLSWVLPTYCQCWLWRCSLSHNKNPTHGNSSDQDQPHTFCGWSWLTNDKWRMLAADGQMLAEDSWLLAADYWMLALDC